MTRPGRCPVPSVAAYRKVDSRTGSAMIALLTARC